jgi:hypothetical protein
MFNPASLKDFIALVSANERTNKSEVRLSTTQARRIADDLSFLMLTLVQSQEQNIKLQEQVIATAVTDVELQGGKFT